jgi:hypothetical protein
MLIPACQNHTQGASISRMMRKSYNPENFGNPSLILVGSCLSPTCRINAPECHNHTHACHNQTHSCHNHTLLL